MRRGRFAVLLALSMAFAGCLGPSTASWGDDDGELSVQFSQGSTTITSGLGSESRTITNLEAMGCSSDAGALEANSSTPISFSGYLGASHFYSSHSEADVAVGLDLGVATSVAIQSMTFEEAKNIIDGDGPRIEVKNWDQPLEPDTGTGSVDLDKLGTDSETSWYILGLIPTTENILDGLTALDEWHQAVTINGYLVKANSTSVGYYNNYHATDLDCSLVIDESNHENVYVLVTSIELDGSSISSNGESVEEWVHGDVPFLGRAGYILFFLIFGIGGGIGAFILSKMFVVQGANSTMKTLLGKAGMDTIKQVKKDVKSAKKTGLVSPNERKLEARKHAVKNAPPQSQKADSGPALAAFDLDSVLSSGQSTGSATEFGGNGSSVVETIESQEMARDLSEQSSDETPPWQKPSSMHSSSPPRQTHSSVTSSVTPSVGSSVTSSVSSNEAPTQPREHFTSSAPPSTKSAGPPKKKSIRKRKTSTAQEEQVQKESQAEPQSKPQAEPQESRNTFEEPEEDFSDFSF